jgi:hypothetical protein
MPWRACASVHIWRCVQPALLARAWVALADVPIVREVSVLRQAERPPSRAQQAVFASLVAHGWGRP